MAPREQQIIEIKKSQNGTLPLFCQTVTRKYLSVLGTVLMANNKRKKDLTIMKKNRGNAERGIAMLYTIFALLLLGAMASALTFTASLESSVNSNYRQEQIAYFGAKAGLEELRARVMPTDPNSIFSALQITAPTATNNSIVYIINPGSGAATTVQPWSSTSTTFPDDELCHDNYSGLYLSTTAFAPGVPCSGSAMLPTGTTWYTSYTSQLPFNGTSAALPFKWARISPKVNYSASYLNLTGSTPAISYYKNTTTTGYTSSTLLCWNGVAEVPLLTTAIPQLCSSMLNSSQSPMTPVYLLTSLGVSPLGARKMVQAEVALTPTPPFIYGLFATGTACPAISFSGNNPSTDSYTSSGGGTYSSTHTNTGGDIGSNGGVAVGNGNVYGVVGVTSTCGTPVSVGSNGTMLGTVACPSGNVAACFLPAAYSFSIPTTPSNVPTTSTTPSSCGSGGNKHDCLVPGTYGNISITKALTLAPGIYNINSLSMTGNAGITVSPAGAVTINVVGSGQSNPIAIAGNGIIDDAKANDFIINYAGTGTVSVAGNGDSTAILNAPNATMTQQGNGNWYGSIVANNISLGGNAFFHYDRNSSLAPTNNGYFSLISYREIGY